MERFVEGKFEGMEVAFFACFPLCFICSALSIFLGWLLGTWRGWWGIQVSHFALGHKTELCVHG